MKTLRDRVDMAGDGVGAKDVGGEWIEARRIVTEEVGEGYGRKWVRVGVVCSVCKNHLYNWEVVLRASRCVPDENQLIRAQRNRPWIKDPGLTSGGVV